MGERIGVVWTAASTKASMRLPSGRPIQFNEEDVALLRLRVPEIAALSSEYSRRTGLTAGTKTVNARVRGVDPEFGELRNQIPQPGGRFLHEADLRDKRRVEVLGAEHARDLFHREN